MNDNQPERLGYRLAPAGTPTPDELIEQKPLEEGQIKSKSSSGKAEAEPLSRVEPFEA